MRTPIIAMTRHSEFVPHKNANVGGRFPLTEALAMQGVSIGRGFFGQQRLRCCREEELTTALVHKGALCITAKSDRRGPKWVIRDRAVPAASPVMSAVH